MTPTERTPICIETGNKYRLYFTELCGQPAAYYLIPETGNQSPKVKQFYLSTFDQQIKLNTGKIITLKPHTFYNIKEGEKPTHRKINGLHKRFINI